MKGIEFRLDMPMAEAEDAVRKAMGEVGFGVLTEIDVASTLQAKLGVSRAPLKILGACNPSFAYRALELDPSFAMLLPCNVVFEEVGDGCTHIVIADPRALLALGEPTVSASLAELGKEAAMALEAMVNTLVG